MDNLTPQEQEKAKKMMVFEKDPALGILNELNDTNQHLKDIANKEPNIQKIQIEGLKGEKGDAGEKGDTGEQGLPGEKGMDGKNGLDGKNGVDGIDGLDGEDGLAGEDGTAGKDGSPDTAEQVRDKLASLEGEERLDKSAIKGLDEMEQGFNKQISNIPRGGSRSNNSTKFYPLTADGITKIFLVPKSVASIVLMSDFPNVLFENSGFTINATRTQITLTTDTPPSVGSQLLYQYSSQFN